MNCVRKNKKKSRRRRNVRNCKIRGVDDCAVRKNPRKITDAKLRLKGVINCVNDIEIKDLIN